MPLVNVPASDELPHAVGSESGWSESYSFQLVDPREGIALLTRIGVRPNEGIMDVGLDVYLPDGGMLAARHVAAASGNTADLAIEGVRYELVRPLEEWRVTYDGPAHSLASSRDAGRHEAWHGSRLERLSLDLRFVAEAAAAAVEPATARFGQAGRFTGEVWVSGDSYRLDVPGLREKSWGAAGTEIPRLRRRFWIRFGDEAALVVDRRVTETTDELTGWMLDGGRVRALESVALRTETEPDSFFQKSFSLTARDDAGVEHALTGEVVHLAPLPTVRGTVRAVVCTSVARFSWSGREGVGIAEYVHRLDAAGNPLLPVAEWG
ncbi:MAG: hypothetical protein FJ144_04330 [Deltaproteobacteria bacterium]|nr:hypothetical protein [Deltaproteobacteria bacterium]